MTVKKYVFAGLDFIFDREGNPWFLEANGSPHGMRNFERLFGSRTISRKVADYMLRQGKERCVVISAVDKPDNYRENGLWVYNKLREMTPGLRLCHAEKNARRRKKLSDVKGEAFEPGCIFRYGQKMSPAFEKRITMINPTVMRYLTMDKMLCSELVKRRLPHVRVPHAFVVRSSAELRKRLKDNHGVFRDGYVLKPNYESLGFGVRVFSSPDEKAVIRKPAILQQRIVPKLMGGKYWDLRAFLFDGKFAGAEIRLSKDKVTNAAMGSSVEKAPGRFVKRVEKISEEIVMAIDDYAGRISASPRLFGNLRKRIPKTVINK